MTKNRQKNANDVSTAYLTIDYDKLADAIVKAQTKANIEENKEVASREAANIKVNNYLKKLWKIITYKKKNVTDDRFIFSLLVTCQTTILGFIELGLWFLIIAWIYGSLTSEIGLRWLFPAFAIITFVFERIIRVARFEVDKITDKNYLIGVLSATTSFIAMILAIIALFMR